MKKFSKRGSGDFCLNKMITVRIFGGLGNQLFQYAFGRRLSLKLNTGLMLNYYDQILRTDFDGENLTRITDVFDLPVKLYIGKIRKRILNRNTLSGIDHLISAVYAKTRYFLTENNYDYSQNIIKESKNIYASGYWQNEKYFKDIENIIRKDFKFKIEQYVSNLDIYKEITKNNSISLHIRGKDYLTKTFYARCDVRYYLDAISIISKDSSELKFYIFTDDVDNVHQNYKELLKFSEIVNPQTIFIKPEIVDLVLMSKCKHNIICNSSFSWWGAWLNNNPNKIVISPKKWFSDEWVNNPHYSAERRIPADWHEI